MGKKILKLPLLFKNKESRQPWQWPSSCKQPKTLSFRAAAGDDVFKTVNSVFFDHLSVDEVETPETWFTNSSGSGSFSTRSEDSKGESSSLEMIIRGVAQLDRLFFEPAGDTRSISKGVKAKAAAAAAAGDVVPVFKDSVVLAMESEDPYEDFRRSMEEMVESHGLKEWECLEELLGWYLRVNGKINHGFIVGAFVDLLVQMVSCTSGSTTTTTFSSAASSFSSPSSPLSPFVGQKEIDS